MNIIKTGLTSFQLKIIALISMTIDHIGAYSLLTQSPDINIYMRITGRIAAPVFLFLLVEGIRHTRDRRKYILRLYAAAVITELIRGFFEIRMGNIFQTFFYAALYITCLDIIFKRQKHSLLASVFIALPMFLQFLPNHLILRAFFPPPLTVEFTFVFILLAVAWYFINNKIINCAVLAGLSVIVRFFPTPLSVSVQWLMILAVTFLLFYNGKKGRSGLKYLFYVYYPAHSILFFLLSNLLN